MEFIVLIIIAFLYLLFLTAKRNKNPYNVLASILMIKLMSGYFEASKEEQFKREEEFCNNISDLLKVDEFKIKNLIHCLTMVKAKLSDREYSFLSSFIKDLYINR